MKKLLLLTPFCLSTFFAIAQNIYPWPSSGNVGIGTTSPAFSLNVAGNSTSVQLRLERTNTSQGAFDFGSDNTGFTIYPGGYPASGVSKFFISSSGSVGIGTITPTFPLNIAGSNTSVQLRIERTSTSQGIFDLGADNNGFTIYPGGYQASGASKFFISSAGNVGIGTVTPATIGNYGVLAINGRSPSQGGYMSFQTNGTETGAIVSNSQFNFQASANIITQFYTGGTQTMQISALGNVLLGKVTQQNTAYKLDVAGQVRADAITVNTSGADFVFEDNYHLKKLSEVSDFIQHHKHLPEIPSAAYMQKEGTNLGEMNKKLLQKIEELTLYLIEKDKQIQVLQKGYNRLNKKFKSNM